MEILYNQGSVKIPEDGIIYNPPFHFGVSDGVSGLYLPEEEPLLFEGRTGGQLASHALSWAFAIACSGQPLLDILKDADNMLRQTSESARLKFDNSEILPSAAFAIASVQEVVRIFTGGDSLAVWRLKDGTMEGSPNRMYCYEMRLLKIIAELMAKHLPLSKSISEARKSMWREFRPILTEARRANVNKGEGYSLINGQKRFNRLMQSFAFGLQELDLLILFTDGLVPVEWTRDVVWLAKTVIRFYESGGLQEVLKSSREIAEHKKFVTHETIPEATAIAIEF